MKRGRVSIDRSKVRTVSARGRHSKVRTRQEARPYAPGASFASFLEGLPAILGAAELKAAIAAWAKAWRSGRPVLWGCGAHLIKLGLLVEVEPKIYQANYETMFRFTAP